MFFLLPHVQLPVLVLLVVVAGVVLVPPASVLRSVVSIPTAFVPVPAGRRNSVQQNARRLNMAEATSTATDLVYTVLNATTS